MEDKTWRDIIREEWGKLSQLTWGQRLGYIWDYYKPLMAAVLAVIFIISTGVTIYHNLQLTDILQVYFIDCNALEVDSEEMVKSFTEYLGGLDEKDVITIDVGISLDENGSAAYAEQIKFTALVSNGDIDILLLGPELFEKYQKEGYFLELSEILSEEQQQAWSECLVYAENPEDGQSGAFALNVQDFPVIQEYNAYYGEPVYAAVMSNAKHVDLCDDFLNYLAEE